MTSQLNVAVIAESFVGEANGVHTAIQQLHTALRTQPNVTVTENTISPSTTVIHAHTIGLQYILKTMGAKRRKKTIVSAHVIPDSFIDSLILSRWWRVLAKLYLKFAYNRAHLVLAVSPTVKSELEKLNLRSRIEVLCNSINRSRFTQNSQLRRDLRRRLHLSQDAFVAVGVGQIQPRKGIVDFIETAQKCPSITFVWIGGRPYGRLTADYAALTKTVDNAPDNVIFTDIIPFEDMPGYYAMSDIYFLPSLQENFAFATIEAAAIPLPLVLRDNPEYPDTLFTHYQKGRTANDYAAIISRLAQDSSHLKKWQTESDTLAEKYTLRAYTQKLMAIYQSVADNGMAPPAT